MRQPAGLEYWSSGGCTWPPWPRLLYTTASHTFFSRLRHSGERDRSENRFSLLWKDLAFIDLLRENCWLERGGDISDRLLLLDGDSPLLLVLVILGQPGELEDWRVSYCTWSPWPHVLYSMASHPIFPRLRPTGDRDRSENRFSHPWKDLTFIDLLQGKVWLDGGGDLPDRISLLDGNTPLPLRLMFLWQPGGLKY
jgi:hypothetical protein